MQLILIRHADAGDPGRSWPDDNERPLTDLGRAQSVSVGKALARTSPSVDVLCSTPLLRARQTAAIIGEAAAWTRPVIHDLDIAAAPRELSRSFDLYEAETIAYVGHEPTLSRLITLLLTGNEAPAVVQMRKASCATLTEQGTSTILTSLIHPDAVM